jgi:asparagine synthase (glutamine-hydrolysing)
MKRAQRWLIARDAIGIIPLYTGHDAHGNLYVASELKALAPVCKDAQEFPPGHYWLSGEAEPQSLLPPRLARVLAAVENGPWPTATLRAAFEAR